MVLSSCHRNVSEGKSLAKAEAGADYHSRLVLHLEELCAKARVHEANVIFQMPRLYRIALNFCKS